jgi:hypothetical protein
MFNLRRDLQTGWHLRHAAYLKDLDALLASDSLDTNTGLFDTHRESDAINVRNPYRITASILHSAYRLGQDIVLNVLRTHWPHVQRERYFEVPRQVQFGFGELESVFGAFDRARCGTLQRRTDQTRRSA